MRLPLSNFIPKKRLLAGAHQRGLACATSPDAALMKMGQLHFDKNAEIYLRFRKSMGKRCALFNADKWWQRQRIKYLIMCLVIFLRGTILV